jgi:hypothetical protein
MHSPRQSSVPTTLEIFGALEFDDSLVRNSVMAAIQGVARDKLLRHTSRDAVRDRSAPFVDAEISRRFSISNFDKSRLRRTSAAETSSLAHQHDPHWASTESLSLGDEAREKEAAAARPSPTFGRFDPPLLTEDVRGTSPLAIPRVLLREETEDETLGDHEGGVELCRSLVDEMIAQAVVRP